MWEWMFVCLHIQTDIQYTHWLHIIHIFPLHNNTHFKCSATWGIKGHRYSFSIVICPCCLCAEISLDSLRLLMIIMDHRLWNPWILCACMLGNVVLKLTGLFAHTVGHSGEPHPTLAYEQLSLSEMHFLFRIIFPINLFIFGMFQTDVWWVFLNLLCLLLLLVPLSQLLENMLLASHSKKPSIMLINWNIKYLFCSTFHWLYYRLKRILLTLYSIFIYILHSIPTSLEILLVHIPGF